MNYLSNYGIIGSNGKLAVVGSGAMFSDQYIDKEDNNKIKDVIFEFLTSSEGGIKLNEIDAEDPEISDYNMIPDTSKLSDSVRVCLQVLSTDIYFRLRSMSMTIAFLFQESDEIPADYTRLFEQRLFSFSTQLLPSAVKSYDTLGVKHEQLRLITPQFETPLPPLAAAVFPPTFRELTNPQVSISIASLSVNILLTITLFVQLELFDLDEAFSSEKSRLAQITNKCSDEDIDYFVREAADILGVTQSVPNLGGVNTTKRILEYVLAHIVEFKKLNQDTGIPDLD